MSKAEQFTRRIDRLQKRMENASVGLAAIAPTANMRYLLGFAPLMDERFCALLVTPWDTRMVVPSLNADQTEAHTGMEAVRWQDEDGPHESLATVLGELNQDVRPILAADNAMRADHLILLQDLVQPSRTLPAGELMAPLRMCKSEEEIRLLRRSAALADQAMQAGVEACHPGTREQEVGEAIARRFREGGASAIDFIIVASGPNGAFPHHETGRRRLQEGDTVIIDIGATLDGYKSDITRVVHLGRPSEEVAGAYEAVREANHRGRLAAHPGAQADEVDRAARQCLEDAGLGPYFTHRTGHGLGLEAHEPPWIMSGSDTVLRPGMVFSIEPGVYLPGKFGIRVEDIVVITDHGCQVLSELPREMIIRE